MIELQIEQGSEAWGAARLGIPTASQFHRILSPASLKASASAPKYLAEKLAERLLGIPMDVGQSGPMRRGSMMEAEAVAWYEFQQDVTTRRSGICLNDERTIGASVDRMVGEDGILEVKCPMAPAHLLSLIDPDPSEHRLQCQGQLWLTGRKWVDLLSFFAELPVALVRVERDDEAIARIADEVGRFTVRLDYAEKVMRQRMGQEVAA